MDREEDGELDDEDGVSWRPVASEGEAQETQDRPQRQHAPPPPRGGILRPVKNAEETGCYGRNGDSK